MKKAKKKRNKRAAKLITTRVGSKIPNVMRQLVIDALIKRRWTAYRLAKEVTGKVSPQTIYNYIAERRDIMAESLPPILEALGLEIRPKE